MDSELPIEPDNTPDGEDMDRVLKPKKKMNLSDERRKQLSDRMRIVAAERVDRLRREKEERAKVWNQDPPPKPCEIGKGKYKHQPRPVVLEPDEPESETDSLPDPTTVVQKQTERMNSDLRDEMKAREAAKKKILDDRKRAADDKLKEERRRVAILESASKKLADDHAKEKEALRLERENLAKERKEFEDRVVKEKAAVKPVARRNPEYSTPTPKPAPPPPVIPSAPVVRGKFVR
jgi:hypothetical protein